MDDGWKRPLLVAGVAACCASAAIVATRFWRPRRRDGPLSAAHESNASSFEFPSSSGNSPALRKCTVQKKDVLKKGKWLQFGVVSYSADSASPTGTGAKPPKQWEMVERTTKRDPSDLDGVDVLAVMKSSTSEERIALILNYRPPVNQYVLEFPAGLVEDGETAESAALRELKEETGLEGELKEVSPTLFVDPWKSNETTKIARANVDSDLASNLHPKQQLDGDELIELVFFPIRNLMGHLRQFCDKYKTGIDSKLYTFALGLDMSESLRARRTS